MELLRHGQMRGNRVQGMPVGGLAERAGEKMSSDAEGNETQRKAARILRAQGYLVQISHRTSKFRHGHWQSDSNDFFHAFDLICTRLGSPVRWVQVTTMSNTSARIKKVDPIPIDLNYASVEVWGWKGGQRRKHKITGIMLDRQYFQVYYKKKGWVRSDEDKIYLDPDHLKIAVEKEKDI